MNPKNQQFVTEDMIKNNPNAIVYDVDELSEPNLPDMNLLLDNIIQVLEAMNEDYFVQLKRSNIQKYEQELEQRFPSFSNQYYAMFQKIISGEDLTHLFSMLEAIENVNQGHISLEEVEIQLGKKLAKDYYHGDITDEQMDKAIEIEKEKEKRRKLIN